MPTLFRIKKWHTYYINYVDRSGRRCRKSLGVSSRREATEKFTAFLAEYAAARAQENSPVTQQVAVEGYLSRCRELAPGTARAYGYNLQRFTRWFGAGTQLRTLTPVRLADFRLYLVDRKFAPDTIDRTMGCLAMFLNWAVERGYLDATPMTRGARRVAKTREREKRALSAEERAVYDERLRGTRYYALYMLASRAGLRRAELAALEGTDFRDGVIHLTNKPQLSFTLKHYRPRPIPLSADLVPVVAALPKQGPVFRGTHGSFRAPIELANSWERVCQRYRLPPVRMVDGKVRYGVTLHELRHTYASLEIQEQNTDIYTLQRRMGHRDITTTSGYFHAFKP